MKFANPFRSMSGLQMALFALVALAAVFFLFAGDHATAAGLSLIMANPILATPEALAAEMQKCVDEAKGIKSDLGLMKNEFEAKLQGKEYISKELKESIDKALENFNAHEESIKRIDQQLKTFAKEGGGDKREKSWGQQFIESDAYKNAANRGARGSVIMAEVKTVTSANAGGLIRSQRENDLVGLARERRVVRDLLRTIPVTSNAIDYAKQTTRTNNAAPVAEGSAKPYSDFVWSSDTVNIRTLAHLAKVTRQAMDDAPRLMAEMDVEMRYGLGYVEERQFLYGSGVGQNLHGIIPQATVFSNGTYIDLSATRIDVLRLAMLQCSQALFPADGIVLNDADWAYIELTKTDDGAYLFANVQGQVSPRLWGLPVVTTPAMDVDDFLVGNFTIGATVYDRMGVEVLLSTENVDDFENNLATMRAEERVAIAVKRPGAFVTGDFTTAIGATNGP